MQSSMQIMPDRQLNRTMDSLSDQNDMLMAFRRAVAESREAQAAELAEYDRNWRYYMGQHYLRRMGDRYIPDTTGGDKLRLQRDIIQLAIDALRPILVKMSPHILVLASYPDKDAELKVRGRYHSVAGLKNADVASFLSNVLLKEHRRRHDEILKAEMVLEVMVTGQAYRALLPTHNHRLGTVIEPKLYSQDRIMKDPKGTRLADFRDFKYIIFEDELDAAEIEQLTGVKESKYTQQNDISDSADAWTDRDYEGTGLYKNIMEYRRYGGNISHQRGMERRMYKYQVGYFNDAGTELAAYHNKDESTKLKFPMGRQIVVINEQYVHSDGPNPNWHGDYPLTCYQSLPVPHIARALNEVGKLKDVQKGVNLLMNALIGTTMLGANPKLFYEEGAFNTTDWHSGPGGMIRFNQGALSGDKVSWFQPSGTDRGSFNMMKDLEMFAKEDVAGVTPSIQGQEAPAGSSGVLYNSQQSASMTGPTFRIQMLDAGHHREARQETELIQQWVDFAAPHYSLYHDIDKYHPLMGEAVRDLYYSTEYESQAELPHNPIARQNFYWNQFLEGVIDFEEYILKAQISMRPELREQARQGSLENYMPGIPRQVRIELMIQAAQAAAQAQAAQGQMNAAGGQPGLPAGGQEQAMLPDDDGMMGDPAQRRL